MLRPVFACPFGQFCLCVVFLLFILHQGLYTPSPPTTPVVVPSYPQLFHRPAFCPAFLPSFSRGGSPDPFFSLSAATWNAPRPPSGRVPRFIQSSPFA